MNIIGMSLERILPAHIQSIIFISIIGLLVDVPCTLNADFMANYVSQVELTKICTAFLGYVSIAIEKIGMHSKNWLKRINCCCMSCNNGNLPRFWKKLQI